MSRLKCHNKCTKEAPPCHLLIIQRGGPDTLKGNAKGNNVLFHSILEPHYIRIRIQNSCILYDNLEMDETTVTGLREWLTNYTEPF